MRKVITHPLTELILVISISIASVSVLIMDKMGFVKMPEYVSILAYTGMVVVGVMITASAFRRMNSE